MSATIQDLLTDFATTLSKSFGAMGENPGQREDQLKSPIKRLVEGFAESLSLDAVANSEATSQGGVRPDFGVSVRGLLTGHIELKAPGKGVKPSKAWDKHDKDQFTKLQDLPNLIYTDGNEFALYRSGAVVGKLIAADGDMTKTGETAVGAEMPGQIEALLRDFLNWTPIVPKSPKALADLLAPLTRYLRDTVSIEMDREGAALAKLAEEWRDYFFADADDEQFADAYAQTVTYALLLARVEGATDLRSNAVSALEEHHGLLARVLRWLSDDDARSEVEVPIDLLERAIEQVDPDELAVVPNNVVHPVSFGP
ncbi:MAG: hypothetical protein HYX29_00005 [Solirubrobacterales bacterium]|nr:hypothetical protein [Solirubrobacterales bacterium]